MPDDLLHNDPKVQQALIVKAQVLAELKSYPNVTGLGVGYKIRNGKRTEIVSIRVYVSKKIPKDKLSKEDLLPASIRGIPLDVIEMTAKAHSEFTSRHNPLLGGISVGNFVLGGSGTLGTSVFDNVLGENMVFSNWHVLCGRLDCSIGESVIQPGTGGSDTGQASDEVARLYRVVLNNEVDAAIARLTGMRFLTREIQGLGPVNGIGQPILGLQVTKAGRTTGVTTGTITDISSDIDVQYDDATRHLINQIVIEGDNASRPGDSGSVWMDNQGNAIGLNFAGNDDGKTAFANRFATVVDALNINLNYGITMQDFVAVSNLELL